MDGASAAFTIVNFTAAALAALGLVNGLLSGRKAQRFSTHQRIPPAWNRWQHQRRRKAFIRQFPDALQALASGLRAGSNLSRGLESIARHQPAPVANEFAHLIHRQRLGEPIERSLDDLHARIPTEEVALLRSAITVSQQVGGDLAGTLDELISTLRERAAVEERVQALTAMGRMQGRVMTLLPFAIAAMLYLQQPALMSRLFTEPMGLAVVALAGIMMGLAAWSIRRIVSIDI